MSVHSYEQPGPGAIRRVTRRAGPARRHPGRAADGPAGLRGMPADEELYDLADFFKIFGDSTRIRILYALYRGELCVQDLAGGLGMGQSAVSHQLRVLKASGLVRYRRAGRRAYYALDDEHIEQIVTQGLTHVRERR
jgi:ArsR family transcriptional regulator, lead/cadmium/zinc/bismuth-responsive transcriptional repressor